MGPLSLEYFAGLFDGEGSVSINKSKANNGKYYHKLVVQLSMCDAELVKEIHRDFGGFFYVLRRPTKRGLIPVKWMIEGKNAVALLLRLEPYLRSKHSLVAIAKAFQETIKPGCGPLSTETLALREQLRAQVRAINASN